MSIDGVLAEDTDRGGPDHEVVVIGAGFSGIGVGIGLLKDGFSDFLILDEAQDVGGTWHWNTYPGIAVDIPSYSYQFSFEKRSSWSRTYAPGSELKDYAKHCVEKYGLASRIRFGITIARAEFYEECPLWRLYTSTEEELTARFVTQVFWQDSSAGANSDYFDKHGDVPLRPTTTVESILRSRRFDLADYRFEQRPAKSADTVPQTADIAT